VPARAPSSGVEDAADLPRFSTDFEFLSSLLEFSSTDLEV
jgi:hypothetical protein